jgi:hypothetical protein
LSASNKEFLPMQALDMPLLHCHSSPPPISHEVFTLYKHTQPVDSAARCITFKELLTRANIEDDPISGMKHTIYSLRHTAICMRIILSDGRVNIFQSRRKCSTSSRGSILEISRSPRKWRSTCRFSGVHKAMFYARIRKINPRPIRRSRDLDF